MRRYWNSCIVLVLCLVSSVGFPYDLWLLRLQRFDANNDPIWDLSVGGGCVAINSEVLGEQHDDFDPTFDNYLEINAHQVTDLDANNFQNSETDARSECDIEFNYSDAVPQVDTLVDGYTDNDLWEEEAGSVASFSNAAAATTRFRILGPGMNDPPITSGPVLDGYIYMLALDQRTGFTTVTGDMTASLGRFYVNATYEDGQWAVMVIDQFSNMDMFYMESIDELFTFSYDVCVDDEVGFHAEIHAGGGSFGNNGALDSVRKISEWVRVTYE